MSHPATGQSDDITIAILAGVLLPLLFSRPSILHPDAWPFARESGRRLAEAIMSIGAALGAAFVYLALATVLRVRPAGAGGAVISAACALLIMLWVVVHLLPLLAPPRPRRALLLMAVTPVGGLMLGAMYTENAIDPSRAVFDSGWWALLVVMGVCTAAALWYAQFFGDELTAASQARAVAQEARERVPRLTAELERRRALARQTRAEAVGLRVRLAVGRGERRVLLAALALAMAELARRGAGGSRRR